LDLRIKPNIRRVITLSYNIDRQSVIRIADKMMKIEPAERERVYGEILAHFAKRHRNLEQILEKYYRELEGFLPADLKLRAVDKLLLASYFTKEYSIEAAALFNPSIVPLNHPASSEDEQEFVISLRATGEGHISSIEFIQGKIDSEGEVSFKMPESDLATGPEVVRIIDADPLTVEIKFDPRIPLSERVIYPLTADESNGIEDLRLVRFEDKGEITYFGTYTAYDGKNIQTKLLETKDFNTFKTHTLRGAAIEDKGMALFPEKINDQYVMVSRQDGNNLYIMFSDNLFEWRSPEPLLIPEMPWELSKIGNCGSPLKTGEGWLLITHGVGPMRKYQLGACLLDAKNPKKVLGRMKEPLLGPDEDEREGYVPNVIYTCGAMIHRERLVVPYAMSDLASGIAIFNIEEILNAME